MTENELPEEFRHFDVIVLREPMVIDGVWAALTVRPNPPAAVNDPLYGPKGIA